MKAVREQAKAGSFLRAGVECAVLTQQLVSAAVAKPSTHIAFWGTSARQGVGSKRQVPPPSPPYRASHSFGYVWC
eukprot:1064950-Rhodomonas_salina.2